ncbi:MAG: hypothetical protein FWE59_05430 [Oscillospiraceae bacterium]|nr:hypothetical protein [Oscillospiraceae bacterium]
MKAKKLIYAGLVVAMLAVLVMMSVYADRFDASFSNRVILRAATAKGATSEMEDGHAREIREIFGGKKLWLNNEINTSGPQIIFSNGDQKRTLYLSSSDGTAITNDGKSLRLTADECLRVAEILAQYGVDNPFSP